MAEEEKRTLAFQIMEQELQRLTSAAFHDHRSIEDSQVKQRIVANQAVFARLAQRGITWQQFKAAYDNAFREDHEATIDHRLSCLYAGAALAYHGVV